MEPWVPQWPPQPAGRPPAPSRDPDLGLQRDRYYRPIRHSWHNGERVHQRQDMGRSPQPQQDPGADHQQPHYASRPGEWHQPVSRVDYYKGGYPSQLYSRYGFRAWNWPSSPKCFQTDCSFPCSFSFYFSSFSSFSFSTLLHWLSYTLSSPKLDFGDWKYNIFLSLSPRGAS